MTLIQLTPGAGGMYCGNCFRDNALVAALRRLGHDTVMVPLYLPMTLDESPTVDATPTFFGGINVYLDQHLSWYRRAPGWLRRVADSPTLLRWAGGKAARTRASDVGELTVSMLLGERGHQARDLEELTTWLQHVPSPGAVFLSNALLAGFARRLRETLGCPVVCFLQSEESFLDSMEEPWRTRAWQTLRERSGDVDLWVSPSRYFADRMASRIGLDPARISIIPNGILLDGYDALTGRPPRKPGEPIALGFFARMCADKGLDVVVDAFLALRRGGRHPNLRLRIGGGCGPGDAAYVAGLRERIDSAGLGAEVSLHPNVSREEKIAFYAACDVLSVPSRMSESFGLYLIESLAAGTPLVQPAVSAFGEVLTDTGGGVLFEPNTAGALADALEPLLANPAQLAALGAAGRAAVRDRYSDTAMAQRMVAALRTMGVDLGGTKSG